MRAWSITGAMLAWWAVAAGPAAAQAREQEVPVIDTEDATLGTAKVGAGAFHALATLDVRNGDYARGAYDDDDAGLDRLPLHAALGFAAVLHRNRQGEGRLFLIGQSSNGFHAPADDERAAPRAWYESNTIVALAWRPAPGLITAAAYAIKASPNGVSPTTHEASLSARYAGEDGVGRWRPQAVVTRRTQGDGGVFTLFGVSPEVEWGKATVSFPLNAGIGWGGFYGPDSGTRRYASLGASLEAPLSPRAALRVQGLALVRDARLAALDAPKGTDARVVPLVTVALAYHW